VFVVCFGVVVFAVVAMVKALRRKTIGWLITGSIAGVFLAALVIFFIGLFVVSRTTTTDAQNNSRKPQPMKADRFLAVSSPEGAENPHDVTYSLRHAAWRMAGTL